MKKKIFTCLRQTRNQKELEEALKQKVKFTCTKGCIKRLYYINKILKKYNNILQKKGIIIGEYLGSGSCGVVFSVNNPNYVLKVNIVENEIAFFQISKDRKLDNVLQAIDIFKLGNSNCYCMLSKRLKSLNKKEDLLMYNCLSSDLIQASFNDFCNYKINKNQLIDLINMYEKFIKIWLRSNEEQNKNDWINQIVNGVDSIKDIAYPDISQNNVMKFEKKYYLIDPKIKSSKKYLEKKSIKKIKVVYIK